MTNKNVSNQQDTPKRPNVISAISPQLSGTDPRRMGFHGHGKDSTDCGDTIEFFINLEDDKIKDVTCRIHGCNNTLLSARAAGILIKGRSLKEAFKQATPENIGAVSQLPEENKHCNELATRALRHALRSAALSSKEPWRKLYRRH